jgi:allantoate deiminase
MLDSSGILERALSPGARAVFRCDVLGAPPFSESNEVLLRRYLTPAHACAVLQVQRWMADAGMDVRRDAVGNLIGRYEGAGPKAPVLLIGSHLDTVHDAGRYDGALGVMIGIEVVVHRVEV